MPTSLILTINTGSSSLKVEAFENQHGKLFKVFKASAKNIGEEDATLSIDIGKGQTPQKQSARITEHGQAIEQVLDAFDQHFKEHRLICVAHRVVHGGMKFTKACKLDEAAVGELQKLVVLAPDHMPQAIAAINFFAEHRKDLLQVAAFDTTFHSTMPARANQFALPGRFAEQGIRRFGFHGLSYTFIVQALEALEPPANFSRLIVAHLGSGASIAAIKDGRSIDTSMGFSPDSGLVMASRAGDFDASAVLHLIQHQHMSIEEIDSLLNKQSGLKGMAGHGGDMQKLLPLISSDAAAQAAVEMFCYRIKCYIGRYAAALGGCQTLVFTGGIGENAAAIREQVCSGFQFMGVQLDQAANDLGSAVISTPSSAVKIRVIATDEDLVIAQQALALIPA